MSEEIEQEIVECENDCDGSCGGEVDLNTLPQCQDTCTICDELVFDCQDTCAGGCGSHTQCCIDEDYFDSDEHDEDGDDE